MATKSSKASNKEHPALGAVRKSSSVKVKVACSDIDGVLRGKYLHRDKFFGAAVWRLRLLRRGVRLGLAATSATTTPRSPAGSTASPTRWRASTSDTARHVPWDGGVPFFLGEFVNADGSPYPVCPRQTLKRVLKRAEKLGVLPMAGMEFEWFNFLETPQSWADEEGRRPDQPDARACSATRCCA